MQHLQDDSPGLVSYPVTRVMPLPRKLGDDAQETLPQGPFPDHCRGTFPPEKVHVVVGDDEVGDMLTMVLRGWLGRVVVSVRVSVVPAWVTLPSV